MAVKPPSPAPLGGLDALLAGLPQSQTPRGGMEFSFRGESSAPANTGDAASTSPTPEGEQGDQSPFAGMGPWLEDSDADVFKQMDGLVLRQELIALNHLAQDTHWTYVKLGYPWSTLTKEPGKDVYKQSLPYGSAGISIQAVPNKSWDLINKTTEALLVDFPEAEAEPDDDSEDAQGACDMANRFLAQDASEQGTNDAVLFHDRVERSLTCASTYIECWTDPTGGGYVPLQIKAHPQAVDANNPFVNPDGMPTSDYVLRYVTPQGQFTEDPSQAAPQWQPKLRASKWQREHIRVFPETATVDQAEKIIILGYCTLGEAKRRWPSVAQMAPQDLSALTDWTPTRFMALLPPFQRARWKLTDGRDKEKSGSSDERIMFYYHGFAKPSPDYPKGADVVVTGALDQIVLDRKLLAKEVEVDRGQGKVKETRCMEIPVVQITPRGDPDEMDPTGRAFIELFAGAAENNAALAQFFSEAVSQVLHTPFAVPSTSPIHGEDVENARATGDMLLLTKPEDVPKLLQPPPLPTAFFDMYEQADEAINSIASSERAARGADNSKERSGKAIQLAQSANNVSLSGMQTSVVNAYARWCRIKCERAMADFSTPQQISYVGEDGSYKQDEWTGVDFALIGKVTIKAGTGTLMPPEAKVEYLANLQKAGLLMPDEAIDAARPSFSKRLGLPDNPHEQHVERSIDAWLKGPPTQADGMAPWEQQWGEYQQQKQQYDQVMQQYQQQAQAYQIALQNSAIAAGGPPPALLGPEQQNAQAMQQYQMAVLALQNNPLPPAPPQPPQIQAPVAPWHPFQPRPNDSEPLIAAIWVRKLSRVISSVKYSQSSGAWRQPLDEKYLMSRQVLAAVQQAAQQQPQQPQAKSQPSRPSAPAQPPQAHAA